MTPTDDGSQTLPPLTLRPETKAGGKAFICISLRWMACGAVSFLLVFLAHASAKALDSRRLPAWSSFSF